MRISSCYTSPTMATHLPSFSPPLKNSGSRVSLSPLISLRRLNLPWVLLLLFFLFNISITSSASSSSSSSSQISYGESCDSIVPGSNVTGKAISPYGFLQLQNGYYIGGDRILGGISQSSFFNIPKSLSFRTTNIDETITQGVFWVEGWLVFRGANMYASLGNSTLGRSLHGRFRPRGPRFPIRRGGASFGLKGFWSASTGKLCMVGSASSYSKEGKLLKLSAVFKLNYPENSTIFTSLITGSLESLDSADNLNYFEPISLLAFSQKNYNYTLISKENWTGFSGVDGGGKNASLSLPSSKSICSLLHRWTNLFELEYGSDCVAPKNCTPLGGSNGFLPGFMFFGGLQCSDDQRLRLWLGFSNTSYNGYNKPLVPNMTLVGEGAWDGEKNRLCIVACRIANLTGSLTEASVADCSIRLSLRFPATLSIRNRSSVVGQIWSNKTVNGSGDFDRIIFRGEDRMMWVQGLKYEYSVIDNLNNSCPKAVKNKGKRYPDGYSYDMKFDMAVKDHDGQRAWGYLTPLFVGDRFYDHYIYGDSTKENTAAQENTTNHNSLLNVSYKMSFNSPPGFKFGGNSSTAISSSLNTPIQISAEGIYDTETGGMCMVGCYSLGSHHQKSVTNDSMDCKILINVQFAPLDNKVGGRVKGTIKSMRENSDPLHFNSLELSSNAMYRNQAVNSVSRMDLEITMVLISNTLACIFIGLQLFYVKKHPDVLPFISLVMLVILTLGHMIPLLLNFEELFVANRTQQNVLLGSGGWVKVNEVIVRVVTMVAFLLQFRLLQLTWSSKLIDGSQKGLCAAEKKSLKVTLPLYLVGGLIAWFVHGRKNNKASMLAAHVFAGYQQHSIWEDLRSYAGLVLDGFLLPQILLNLFSNTKDKALAHSFYVGNTVVRLLPHAYDLYRTHNYVRSFDVSYFYASPGADFYSTAWDVIIPCGGLLFAVLIYFQQRFGGRCILPPRFREPTVYEKVPVVSSE